MATTPPSTSELVLYIILPIVLFVLIAVLVYWCYRRRTCCFSTKDEALLGHMEKTRFTVDLGKRRRESSITSFHEESFDSYHPGNSQETYQRSRSSSNNNYFYKSSSGKSANSIIIAPSPSVPRPDIKKTVVIGQASNRERNLLPGPHHPQARATSPAQSLPEYSTGSLSKDQYFRNHSYDSSVSRTRLSENVIINTINENELQTNSSSEGSSEDPESGYRNPPPHLRRLRHQGRVKGTENEPSFSRPTKPARVSLVISTVESLDLASSGEEEQDSVIAVRKKGQVYSPSPQCTEGTKGDLYTARQRKISAYEQEQHIEGSSPGRQAVFTEDRMFVPQRSPRNRSRSSPSEAVQTSLDVEALHAALSHHRKSEGDILDNGHQFNKTMENSVSVNNVDKGTERMLAKRKPVADSASHNVSLAINKDPLIPAAGRQRRRSSMQNPIDLRQINPKLYEDMIRLPSMDSEEPDDETAQIHFSLDYNKEMEVLTVKLIQARNLQTQAFSGTCDPYCTVAILPGFNARQSKVHKHDTDPEFEEKFVFGVRQSDLAQKTIEIRTYDFDQFSRDECTGVMAMKMDVLDFDMSRHYDLWKKFRTQDLSSSVSTALCGDLLLALSYLPSAEKLTVAIQKARNLKSAESRKGPPDPYIKVCIYRGNQRLKKKKTDTMHGTYNPVFNQALTFSISPELMQCPIIRITCQVVHDQKLSSNEDLGILHIGPSSKGREELNHWRDVSGKYSNKPVARWHRLEPASEISDADVRGQFLPLAEMRRSSSALIFPAGKLNDRRDSNH